jgi:hypothetical protein
VNKRPAWARSTRVHAGPAVSRFWRFAPSLYGIDGVPAVLIVVPEPAMNDDARSDAWERNAAERADFGGSQRPAGVRQPDTPASAVASHPYDAPDDGNVPRYVHTPRPSTAGIRTVRRSRLNCNTSVTVEQLAGANAQGGGAFRRIEDWSGQGLVPHREGTLRGQLGDQLRMQYLEGFSCLRRVPNPGIPHLQELLARVSPIAGC